MRWTTFKEWKGINFSPNPNVIIQKNSLFSRNPNVYVLKDFGKKEYFCILWMLSVAFELDANIATFLYYGKTRLIFLKGQTCMIADTG